MINVFGVERLGRGTPPPLAGAQTPPWWSVEGGGGAAPLPLVLIENLFSCPHARYYFTVSFSVCAMPSVTWQAVL